MPETQTIPLHARAKAGLLDLVQKRNAAQANLELAQNSVVAALGLDPADTIDINLDTGVVTVTPKQEG